MTLYDLAVLLIGVIVGCGVTIVLLPGQVPHWLRGTNQSTPPMPMTKGPPTPQSTHAA